jgi:CheY-like chemotaxis protein
VLVVDDEIANLDTFRRVFRKRFELHLVEHSPEAAQLMTVTRFDLAFFDYSMPVLNGLELCRRALGLQPKMARVLLTAHDTLDIVREAQTSGLCSAVVPKPWNQAALLEVVNRLLQPG